jgi:exosome complex exonuclease DIS3/RRP44
VSKGGNSQSLVTDLLETLEEGEGGKDVKAEESQNLIELMESSQKQPTGRVVGVIERSDKKYAGSTIQPEELTPEDFTSLSNLLGQEWTHNFRLFIPFDHRVQKIIIRSDHPEALDSKRIIVKVDDWPSNSHFPIGHLVRIIGSEGDTTTESLLILHEFNVIVKPFSQRILDCLPNEGREWTIPEEEISRRKDLRHLNICSIDPPGCKDIDDALHC